MRVGRLVAQISLLYDVFGIAGAAQHAVRDRKQQRPQRFKVLPKLIIRIVSRFADRIVHHVSDSLLPG